MNLILCAFGLLTSIAFAQPPLELLPSATGEREGLEVPESFATLVRDLLAGPPSKQPGLRAEFRAAFPGGGAAVAYVVRAVKANRGKFKTIDDPRSFLLAFIDDLDLGERGNRPPDWSTYSSGLNLDLTAIVDSVNHRNPMRPIIARLKQRLGLFNAGDAAFLSHLFLSTYDAAPAEGLIEVLTAHPDRADELARRVKELRLRPSLLALVLLYASVDQPDAALIRRILEDLPSDLLGTHPSSSRRLYTALAAVNADAAARYHRAATDVFGRVYGSLSDRLLRADVRVTGELKSIKMNGPKHFKWSNDERNVFNSVAKLLRMGEGLDTLADVRRTLCAADLTTGGATSL